MNWWHKRAMVFRALFWKEKLDRDMDEEMRSHLEMRMQANLEAGLSAEDMA